MFVEQTSITNTDVATSTRCGSHRSTVDSVEETVPLRTRCRQRVRSGGQSGQISYISAAVSPASTAGSAACEGGGGDFDAAGERTLLYRWRLGEKLTTCVDIDFNEDSVEPEILTKLALEHKTHGLPRRCHLLLVSRKRHYVKFFRGQSRYASTQVCSRCHVG